MLFHFLSESIYFGFQAFYSLPRDNFLSVDWWFTHTLKKMKTVEEKPNKTKIDSVQKSKHARRKFFSLPFNAGEFLFSGAVIWSFGSTEFLPTRFF